MPLQTYLTKCLLCLQLWALKLEGYTRDDLKYFAGTARCIADVDRGLRIIKCSALLHDLVQYNFVWHGAKHDGQCDHRLLRLWFCSGMSVRATKVPVDNLTCQVSSSWSGSWSILYFWFLLVFLLSTQVGLLPMASYCWYNTLNYWRLEFLQSVWHSHISSVDLLGWCVTP